MLVDIQNRKSTRDQNWKIMKTTTMAAIFPMVLIQTLILVTCNSYYRVYVYYPYLFNNSTIQNLIEYPRFPFFSMDIGPTTDSLIVWWWYWWLYLNRVDDEWRSSITFANCGQPHRSPLEVDSLGIIESLFLIFFYFVDVIILFIKGMVMIISPPPNWRLRGIVNSSMLKTIFYTFHVGKC